MTDERVREIAERVLSGIDKTEIDDPKGWWETSIGAEFGAQVKEKLVAEFQALSVTIWREGMLEAAGICEAKAMFNWATGARNCAAAIREQINSQQKASKK